MSSPQIATKTLAQSLDNFMVKVVELNSANPEQTALEYDKDWTSECITSSDEAQSMVFWQPLQRANVAPANTAGSGSTSADAASFSNVEEALDIKLNEDFCEYFTRYYSADICAQAQQGNCELLQVWNDDDFARLQENTIGHILMKRRLGQPETLFFGLTDEEDFILVIDNQSGAVMLEQVGCVPTKTLAPDLATFIDGLTPTTRS